MRVFFRDPEANCGAEFGTPIILVESSLPNDVVIKICSVLYKRCSYDNVEI